MPRVKTLALDLNKLLECVRQDSPNANYQQAWMTMRYSIGVLCSRLRMGLTEPSKNNIYVLGSNGIDFGQFEITL